MSWKPQFEVGPIGPQRARKIWSRLKEVDRQELAIQCEGDPCKRLTSGGWWAAMIGREPVACFGHWPFEQQFHAGIPEPVRGTTLWFGFAATTLITPGMWPSITSMAQSYVTNRSLEHRHLRARAMVWDKHVESIRWLKVLGFEDTGIRLNLKGETMIIVQRPTVK